MSQFPVDDNENVQPIEQKEVKGKNIESGDDDEDDDMNSDSVRSVKMPESNETSTHLKSQSDPV